MTARPLSRAMQAVANTLLPQDCVLCSAHAQSALLCTACLTAMPRLRDACPCCAQPSRDGAVCGACIRRPPRFDATTAACIYEYPLDRLMRAYKYGGMLALSDLFAGLLADAISDASNINLIIPLPLGISRLRERGFNQSHEIARRLGARIGIRCDAHAVTRVRDTSAQAELPIDARIRNVRNAFSATAAVMGRRIAVVDDVMTTGATLDEVARTLKSHGALHVENWVVARALLDP